MSTSVPDPDLPAIEGGWELLPLAADGSDPGSIQLWAPARPDELFDADEIPASDRFHGAMPYWAWLWESAPEMVRTLEKRALTGRVLEVGAGLGAVGIGLAARAAGRIQMTLSDYDPLSVAALRVNAVHNGLPADSALLLDWRALEAAPPLQFDAIIGCEVIYDPKSHGALLDVFERYLAPGGRVFLADPGRERVPQFLRRAIARGFQASVEDATGARADPKRGEFRVLVLHR